MLTIAPHLTQRFVTWPVFKTAYNTRPGLRVQSDDGPDLVTVYFYDGPEIWLCQLWKGAVPASSAGSVTQEQANEWLAEWQQSFSLIANRALEARTSDSVPFVSTNIFPPWAILYFAGCGDTDVARGAGTEFRAVSDAVGDTVVEWGFVDGVYAAGGGIGFQNGEPGDWCSLDLLAPASVVAPAPAMNGNVNLVPMVPGGPAVLIVPAVNNSGAYTLVSGVPVPAIDSDTLAGSGFWEWDDPWTGKGEIRASPPGVGKWHLLAAPVPLARFVAKLQLLGTGVSDITVPTIKPKYLLPHWRWRLTLHNSGHSGLKVSWWLVLARKQTV